MNEMAYSLELRSQAVAFLDEGYGQQAVAEFFGVSDRWLRRLLALRRETGSLEPSRAARGPVPKIAGWLEYELQRLVDELPGGTPAESRERLGVDVSLACVCRASKRLRVRAGNRPCGLPETGT